MKIMTALSAVMFLFLSNGCQNKKKEILPVYNQKIDSLFNAHYSQDLFHGGVVITHNGELVYENYLGLAERSWNIPIKRNTKFFWEKSQNCSLFVYETGDGLEFYKIGA